MCLARERHHGGSPSRSGPSSSADDPAEHYRDGKLYRACRILPQSNKMSNPPQEQTGFLGVGAVEIVACCYTFR